jgi:hypothetical protein
VEAILEFTTTKIHPSVISLWFGLNVWNSVSEGDGSHLGNHQNLPRLQLIDPQCHFYMIWFKCVNWFLRRRCLYIQSNLPYRSPRSKRSLWDPPN